AIPTQPGQQVINAERNRHDRPVDVPESAVGEARIDLLPSCLKLPPIPPVDGSNIVTVDPGRGFIDEIGRIEILRHGGHRSPYPPASEKSEVRSRPVRLAAPHLPSPTDHGRGRYALLSDKVRLPLIVRHQASGHRRRAT